MGRRSRHSAKTGGSQSNRKSRVGALEVSRGNRDDSDDDDPTYNEVERYHNRMEEENYLKLDVDDEEGGGSSSEDDGITKHQEGVFDLGVGGSSDEEDDDDGDSDEHEEEETATPRAKKSQAIASSDSEGDASDSEDDDDSRDESNKLLNWGGKKYSYYHGDTADLEIGQDVEDAYLEEEAAREVEKAQLDDMDDEDFFLGTNANSSEDEESKSNKKRSKNEGDMEIIKSSKSPKDASKLSDKEKIKLLKTHHPELLPLVQHFSRSVSELSETTLVAAGAMLGNGITKCAKEMEAVGSTPAGIQYLITKTMLEASKALNLSLYLLLKSDQASANEDDPGVPLVMEVDSSDNIRNHPVMHRLNQLSVLTDKLREGVEEKTPGLREQMNSLVKAAALMAGGSLSSSDDSEISDGDDVDDDVDDDGTHSTARGDVRKNDASDGSTRLSSDANANDNGAQSSSESDEEHETQESIKRSIMMEAKFALRNEDIARDMDKVINDKKRRLAPTTSDYGDENDEITDKTRIASRKLASTMNSIVQKSISSNTIRKKLPRDEDEDEDYERLQRGLSMMEEELGKGSDDDDDDDDEGLPESDEDDFYKAIKLKNKAKKEAKQQMYAVAPKYPRLDIEVDGERAIGKTILKNRGLVAHKPKINRNPRVKKREDYRKALIRRKGAVREVRTDEGHVYGGEATGIKSGISRSRKLGPRR